MMYMNFSFSNGSYSDGLTENLDQQMYIRPVGVSDFNTSQEVLLNFGGSRDFSSWRDGRNDMVMMSPVEGLSLSLGTNVPPEMQMPHQYQNAENNFSVAVSESRYLKTVQELLDEVVNVKEDMNEQKNAKKELMKEYFKEIDGKLINERPSHPSLVLNEEATGESSTEVAVAEKQELQNKMTKLLSMMEEVDRQYKQYYHQMQVLVSSFDMVAGSGSAKPYTSLTLQTISRHFRCLRDAINSQIHVTKKNLGEEYTFSNEKRIGISRLRYVDQKLRQQRALQHLGMNTWRPQRGLPETSVSILRAWLFEHFLHPYPKDSDKILLARKTGLTRSQVSNWFINARVRLWKPMVEEMYKEEVGGTEMDSNSSSETIPKPVKDTDTEEGGDLGHGGTPKEDLFESKFDNMPMMEYEHNSSFYNLLQSDPQRDRFMYHVSELERFGNRNGVLLRLGLQPEAEPGFETWASEMQFF